MCCWENVPHSSQEKTGPTPQEDIRHTHYRGENSSLLLLLIFSLICLICAILTVLLSCTATDFHFWWVSVKLISQILSAVCIINVFTTEKRHRWWLGILVSDWVEVPQEGAFLGHIPPQALEEENGTSWTCGRIGYL